MARKSLILGIRLAVPALNDLSALADDSWLLGCGTLHDDYTILAFANPNDRKDASLGRIFRVLRPSAEGKLQLELAVVLQDLLPNLSGQSEYHLDVNDAGEQHRIFVSNVMAKIGYKNEEGSFHVLAPRVAAFDLIGADVSPIPANAHPEIQKTMVACRFSMTGEDAEDALSSSLEPLMDLFIRLVNRFITAQIMLSDKIHVVTTPIYERDSFDYMYLAMEGKQAGVICTGRIAANLGKGILNPANLSSQTAEALRPYLSDGVLPDLAISFLRSARSHLQAGLRSYALLQVVIAAEIATTRYVHAKLLSLGVSRSKLRDSERDITFSQMLNIHIPALSAGGKAPSGALLGKMNRARELRNQMMHEGSVQLQKTEVHELYDAASEYIAMLTSLPV